MNLHIATDSKFIDTFHSNLDDLGLLENNKIVVRTNNASLKYVKADVPFSSMYSSKFDFQVGDLRQYQKVFIHQFSPLMYRWVAKHSFNELNWMIWGADLYNLPFIKFNFYEALTYKRFARYDFHWKNMLYLLKVFATSMPFKKRAYAKVNNVLTWMESEYQFAQSNIPELRADHQPFFYENQVPYHQLDNFGTSNEGIKKDGVKKVILGNSGTATNNHLDALLEISKSDQQVDVLIPCSYGDKHYVNFLKKQVDFYKNGRVEFVDKFMPIDEYIKFLLTADALVMNHIRPQGYGNIFMMMYLGKPVFLNDKNISLPDLRKNNLKWSSLQYFSKDGFNVTQNDNRQPLLDLLSKEKLQVRYKKLFGH